jgi:hypothetical protein
MAFTFNIGDRVSDSLTGVTGAVTGQDVDPDGQGPSVPENVYQVALDPQWADSFPTGRWYGELRLAAA